MKRLICTMAVLLALCVPTRAEGVLTADEAMDIILEHHGVETDMDEPPRDAGPRSLQAHP